MYVSNEVCKGCLGFIDTCLYYSNSTVRTVCLAWHYVCFWTHHLLVGIWNCVLGGTSLKAATCWQVTLTCYDVTGAHFVSCAFYKKKWLTTGITRDSEICTNCLFTKDEMQDCWQLSNQMQFMNMNGIIDLSDTEWHYLSYIYNIVHICYIMQYLRCKFIDQWIDPLIDWWIDQYVS